jgi:streptogramin lyase
VATEAFHEKSGKRRKTAKCQANGRPKLIWVCKTGFDELHFAGLQANRVS